MIKKSFAVGFLATALAIGTGAFSSVVYADGVECEEGVEAVSCTASTEEALRYGLSTNSIEEVVVNADLNLSNYVDSNHNVELDLAGHTITSAVNLVLNVSADNLTITDSSEGKTGLLLSTKRYNVIEVDGTTARLTLEEGTIKSTYNGEGYGVYLLNGGSIEVQGGTIDTTETLGTTIGGNNTTGDVHITINGGVLKSKYQSIYMPGQVNVDINGGEIRGGIVARMGQITITGGKILGHTDAAIDTIEEYYSLNNGYPWVGDAIMIMGGTYTHTNTTYGNSLNLVISGGEISATQGHALAVYDMAKVAQTMNIEITGGKFVSPDGISNIHQAIVTDFVDNPLAGYGDVPNYPTLEISGGLFSDMPVRQDIAEGYEPEYDEDEGAYEIIPVNVNYKDDYLEDGGTEEGHLPVSVDFGDDLVADRKADLVATEVQIEGLTLDTEEGGELVFAADIKMVDRNGEEIPVENNSLKLYIDLTDEQYEALAEYDKVQAVYFVDGVETERYDAKLMGEAGGYWLEFETTHLSTYGVVGNTNESSNPGSPDTGRFTIVTVSASAATIMTSVMVGLFVSVGTFVKLRRSRLFRGL